jgi:hypothetical protein
MLESASLDALAFGQHTPAKHAVARIFETKDINEFVRVKNNDDNNNKQPATKKKKESRKEILTLP